MTLNKKLILAIILGLVLVNCSIIQTEEDDSEPEHNEKDS